MKKLKLKCSLFHRLHYNQIPTETKLLKLLNLLNIIIEREMKILKTVHFS